MRGHGQMASGNTERLAPSMCVRSRLWGSLNMENLNGFRGERIGRLCKGKHF